MNPGEIYAKTDAGLREITERKLNLAISLRSVLIMVDCNRSVADILSKGSALQVDGSALASLERAGLIAKRVDASSIVDTGVATALREGEDLERFLLAQQQLSDAIKKHLGFRGRLMIMRLRRARNLRELREFLPDFARALGKRVGAGVATPIVSALEHLILARD